MFLILNGPLHVVQLELLYFPALFNFELVIDVHMYSLSTFQGHIRSVCVDVEILVCFAALAFSYLQRVLWGLILILAESQVRSYDTRLSSCTDILSSLLFWLWKDTTSSYFINE